MFFKSRKASFTSALFLLLAIFAGSGTAWAQKSYDDHDPTDRFYITLGGYSQTELRTTIRIDAKSPSGAIGAGTVVALENLFKTEEELTTVRLDGWYRFNKKHRINWTFFKTERDGLSVFEADEPIDIGDLIIGPGDTVTTNDKSSLFSASWSYSFLNTSKYEAWLGVGLNFQSIDTTIDVDFTSGSNQGSENAKATVPLPVFNFGGRWNFSKRTRMLLMLQIFGIDIGDYSGRLNNTRLLVEYSIIKGFGIGGGTERFDFAVDAEGEDFLGSLDTSYRAFTLYLKGQF